MTTQIDKGSEKQVKFRYDGANRRVYKRYKQWIRDLPPIDQRSANTGELQKYQKGVSYEQQILDAYAGYSAGQTSLKMIPGGHWEYTTNLYLHGGGDNVLVEYTKGTDITEFTQRYIYGPTGLIATERDNALYFVLKDHLGSTRLIVDETGEILAYFHYLPFGDVVASYVNMGGMDYRYTGQEWDNEVGLHNYRARLYDSDLGRFYAVDPAGQFASPYLYGYNNPISYIDPYGLWSWRDARMIFYNAVGLSVLFFTGGTVGWMYDEDESGNWGIIGIGYGGAIVGEFGYNAESEIYYGNLYGQNIIEWGDYNIPDPIAGPSPPVDDDTEDWIAGVGGVGRNDNEVWEDEIPGIGYVDVIFPTNGVVRNDYSGNGRGLGHFGANRTDNGVNYPHSGIDLTGDVYAAISGALTPKIPYRDAWAIITKSEYGEPVHFNMYHFWALPGYATRPVEINQGTWIGIPSTGTSSKKFPWTPHTHFEIRYFNSDGNIYIVDPTPYFFNP